MPLVLTVMATETWCRVTVVGPAGRELGSWVLHGSGAPDIGVVDGLARLELVARRAGGHLVLREVSAALTELLDLAGLRALIG